MSDAESRYEDAKREAWEDAHPMETCPDCGQVAFWMIDKATGTRMMPGHELYRCDSCGAEREAIT